MSDAHAHDHELLTYADQSKHDVDENARYVLMAEALRELLIEKGVVKASDVRERLEFMDSRGVELGAKIIAKAWTDPAYKQRLTADGTAAAGELGIPMLDVELIVVENTDEVHNLVVCTLCSCYPRTILGLPPDWYKSKSYRSRAVHEPRQILAEFGTEIADEITLRVHDSNADMRYLVLPQRPADTDGWSEEELAKLVTRDCLIGVSFPKRVTSMQD